MILKVDNTSLQESYLDELWFDSSWYNHIHILSQIVLPISPKLPSKNPGWNLSHTPYQNSTFEMQ